MKTGSVAVVVVMLIISGCAAFRENNLPVINDANYTYKTQEKVKVKVKVFSKWTIDTGNKYTSDHKKAELIEIHKGLFEKVISDTGCCMLFEVPDKADVVVIGVVLDERNPAAILPAFITGVSLYTIPSWVTGAIHIQVEAKTDKQMKTYDLSDSITLVQWLPMIFVLPFTRSPFEGGNNIEMNVYRNLIVRMQADNLLSK